MQITLCRIRNRETVALDRTLDLKPGATRKEVEQAMKGHILGQAELMGKYGR